MKSNELRDEELAYEAHIEGYEDALRERAERAGGVFRRIAKPPRDTSAAIEFSRWWKPEFRQRIKPRDRLIEDRR